MKKKANLNSVWIIPMAVSAIFLAAPAFTLANTACEVALEKKTADKEENLDLDALIAQLGITEEQIEQTASQPVEKTAIQTNQTSTTEAKPKENFAQVFQADVDMPLKIKMPKVKPEKEAEMREKAKNLVLDVVKMYDTMDPVQFEAYKNNIQSELRKHHVTADGELLDSAFLKGSLGEIDRAKEVHGITGEYKKSLRDYVIEVTKASEKVKIRVPLMQKLVGLIKGKSEQELIDNAISEFFNEMVPIRAAIEATIGNVAEKEQKADFMIKELKSLRLVLRKLESEYEARIAELIAIQNAIVEHIENDPVLSQDPKNSLRRYLTVEMVRDIQKTISRLQENLVTVKNGILSNYTNTEDLKDVMIDLHHTAESLKVTLAITTMDTVVQNAVADFQNLNNEMKQLILTMQEKNADQMLKNGRKSRENAVALQNYVLKHVREINETIETNQIERERFKRASVESSRKFINEMQTHQEAISQLISALEKAEAASVGTSFDPSAHAEYVKRLNVLIAVLNKDRSSISAAALDKAEDVINKGMAALNIRRGNIWEQAAAELEKEKNDIK